MAPLSPPAATLNLCQTIIVQSSAQKNGPGKSWPKFLLREKDTADQQETTVGISTDDKGFSGRSCDGCHNFSNISA